MFVIYDNGGTTADRYTILMEEVFFCMSADALSPLGINMHGGNIVDLPDDIDHLGRIVELHDVPPQVQQAIRQRRKEYNAI